MICFHVFGFLCWYSTSGKMRPKYNVRVNVVLFLSFSKKAPYTLKQNIIVDYNSMLFVYFQKLLRQNY